jgi:hypothetical protein
MLVRERGNKKAICWPFVKPSNGLEPLTPPYHRATSREARAVPGSRGHESRARRRNLLRASDPAWTRVPGWCSLSVLLLLSRRLTSRRELVEGEQECLQLREPLGAELFRPGRLDLIDCCSDDANCGSAAFRDGDPLAALVVWVGPSLEVAELFELAQEVVEGLLADLQPGCELRGPGVVGARPLEDDQVSGVEVSEAALVETLEHLPVDHVHRHP